MTRRCGQPTATPHYRASTIALSESLLLGWEEVFERQHEAGETIAVLLELPDFLTGPQGYAALSWEGLAALGAYVAMLLETDDLQAA